MTFKTRRKLNYMKYFTRMKELARVLKAGGQHSGVPFQLEWTGECIFAAVKFRETC